MAFVWLKEFDDLGRFRQQSVSQVDGTVHIEQEATTSLSHSLFVIFTLLSSCCKCYNLDNYSDCARYSSHVH